MSLSKSSISFITLAGLVCVAACGSSSGDGTPSTTPSPPAAATPAAPPAATDPAAAPPGAPAPPTAPSAGCGAASTIAAGDKDLTLAFGGVQRVVHVHAPPTYDPTKPTPVVFDFHGYLSNGLEQDTYAAMRAKADKAGFIAVHAEGTNHSWNAGACCGDAMTQNIDDLAYVGQILDTLEASACVDAKRVYSTGLSNGGFLSYRIACALSDRFAAIAPVAAVLGIPPASCTPKRAVPIMHFHGTADPLVGYDGSIAEGYPSVADTISGWVTRESCNPTAAQTFDSGDTKCQTYSGCTGASEITLCTVTGGGHTWPGGTVPAYLGKTTTAINATDAMWDFFSKHSLP